MSVVDPSRNMLDPSLNSSHSDASRNKTPAEEAIAILKQLLWIVPWATYGGLWMYFTMYQFGGSLNLIWLLTGLILGGISSFGFLFFMWLVILMADWKIQRSPAEMAQAFAKTDFWWNIALIAIGAGIIVVSVVFNMVPDLYQANPSPNSHSPGATQHGTTS
jgi:hypothetical protein